MARVYIAVAGNMGSGKSSIVDFLCRHFDIEPFYEPNEENPYLDKFYSNMSKWAFHSQLHFLANKFKVHQRIDESDKVVIQDRSIYEDAEIFAYNLYKKGHISREEFSTYWTLFTAMKNSIRPPDLLIYLKCNLRSLKKRIAQRGRAMEKSADDNYLKGLERLYKKWIGRYAMSPVITISSDKLDYLSDFIHRYDVLDEIGSYIKKQKPPEGIQVEGGTSKRYILWTNQQVEKNGDRTTTSVD